MSRLRGFVDCCELLQDERDGDIARDDSNALTLCTIHQARTTYLLILLTCLPYPPGQATHLLAYTLTHLLTYSRACFISSLTRAPPPLHPAPSSSYPPGQGAGVAGCLRA